MSDAAEAAPAESASTESTSTDTASTASTGAPATGAQNASGDFFELEDGQKWTVEDLKKNWNRVRTNYQKGANATQLLTKADQRLKAAQEYEARYGKAALQQRLKTEGAKFLQELEVDPTDFATNLLMPEIERQQMTAEQRAFAEKERAVAEREARIKQWEQEQEQRKYDEQVKQHQENYRKAFDAAVQKAGFGSNANVMRRMAAYMETFVDAEEEPSPEQLAQLVRDDITSEVKALTDSLDGKGVVELLGEALVKKIRAYDLERIRSRRPGAQSQTTPPSPVVTNGTASAPRKYLTEAQRDKELQQRLRALGGDGT
jgi:hypothetical protein